MLRRIVFVAALLGAGPPAPALAGVLTGIVRTTHGTPLPQVVLAVAGPAGRRTVVTGPDGRYRVAGLAPGEYRVGVEIPGFALSPAAGADVAEGETHLDLTLSPAPVREQVVVTATRGDAPLSALGVSTTALDREAIAGHEPSESLHLLQTVPGVAVARAGGLGLQASAFVRGGESRFARLLVDGVPVNEPGGFYNFGGDLPLELERVEVVRGAESSLYGTDALAGVVQIITRHAETGEPAELRGEAEGGSFAWKRFAGGTSGRAGGFDWNAGALHLETDNQARNSAFRETAGAASLGTELPGRSTLHLVARGETSTVGTPGPTAFARPDLDASYDRDDLVLGAELRHASEHATHSARVGFALTNQLSLNPLDSGSYVPRDPKTGRTAPFTFFDFPDPEGFQNDTRRLTLGYQVELEAGPRNLLTLGGDVERETGTVGSRKPPVSPEERQIAPRRTNFGAYFQDRLVAGNRLFVTLGGRVERNDNYGTRAVPRVALAFRLRGGEDATTLRASAGMGIKEPGFSESFGTSFFAKGNPNLKPERSRTFDAGIEQRLFRSRIRFGATVFHHTYLDQIAFQTVNPATFQGTYFNLGKTRGRGVELSLDAAPARGLHVTAAYTLLDGKILTSSSDFDPVFASGQPLLRRPTNQASFGARFESGRISGGAGLVLVGERADSDFLSLGLTRNDGYARLDANVRARLPLGVEVFVAADNLLDREYQEVLGYPALGRTLRVGVRLHTGGRGVGEREASAP